jgi:hypothetical protein
MTAETGDRDKRVRSLWILATVNSGIWAISIIALVFVIRHSPGAKGLFPILSGGTAVATALLSVLRRNR